MKLKDYKKQSIAYNTLMYFSIVLCVSHLTGCGEFAYKRGGNATELQQVKSLCQKESNDQKQMESCLATHGWAVQHLSTADPDPVIEASYEPDNRRPSQPTLVNQTAGTSTDIQVNQVKQNGHQTSEPASQLEKPAAPKQPTDIFNVNSWWRLGNNSTLNSDIQQCVDQLGPEHAPDKELHHATRALLKCMNTKGWKALREK